VEALQEFRIETSSFAPEFGRSPGGQIILTTRSGTNDLHGGVYEYFRNDAMDANDWFANAAAQARAPERHNDFGGYLGGALTKDKTFFFLSFEGAQLRLPKTSVIQVPSMVSRQSAPPALASFLNAYPISNGPVSADGSTAQFTGSYSDSATLNAGSARIDHTFNERYSVFGRYNEAPSKFVQRINALSELHSTDVNTRTMTAGVNMLFSSKLSNSLRGNYSMQGATLTAGLDSFGGAVPPDSSLLLGGLPSSENAGGFFAIGTNFYQAGPIARNRTRQVNFVDDLAISVGAHLVKTGGDYRAILLDAEPNQHAVVYIAPSVNLFLATGQASIVATAARPGKVLSKTLSLYAQDTWKLGKRVTITYGFRWEVSPAPSARGATTLASWANVQNPVELALAPSGTPLWNTGYHNLAPRFGLAYSLTEKGDSVVRVGGGVFYDLGVGSSANVASRFPNFASTFIPGVSVPVGDLTPYLPILSEGTPYQGLVEAFSPDLKLPRSYQWSLAFEKSFGSYQALSTTYVGQAGRDLLRQSAYFQPNPDFTGEFLLTQNQAFSNYHALQLQYRRLLLSRVRAVANYTWSHSLDNASNDVVAGLSNTVISAANDYASSGFDVRHSFSGAVTYELPAAGNSRVFSEVTKGWSLDAIVVARSGFPFNMAVFSSSPDPGGTATSRPDTVPGQPVWIADPLAPGGRGINPGAFSIPLVVRQGTEGRNDIHGFGLTQVDLSINRTFSFGDRAHLVFRTDAFNLFNHPNFSNPLGFLEFGTAYLQSSQMLNQGLGGLNSLFQEGGPRSLQVSLKLSF